MERRTVVLLLAATVLAAGCIGGDGETEPADGSGEDVQPQSEDPRDANATDGDVAAREANTTEAPEPIEAPVDWEGEFGTGGCVPSGPNACTGFGTGGETAHELSVDGAPQAASLTMRWNATTPLMEELELSISRVSSCGDNCRVLESIERVQGASPLTLEASDLNVAANESLALDVDVPRQVPPPVFAFAHHDQPFHVTGALTVQPLADG